jgi:hypothetical protein
MCAILSSSIYVNSRALAGENRMYEELRLRLVIEIRSVLIEEGACKSEIECQQKKLVFVSPAIKGVSVKTYSVTDPAILMRITDKCMKMFYSDKKISIYIENFRISKKEDLKKFFRRESPFNIVKFKREA